MARQHIYNGINNALQHCRLNASLCLYDEGTDYLPANTGRLGMGRYERTLGCAALQRFSRLLGVCALQLDQTTTFAAREIETTLLPLPDFDYNDGSEGNLIIVAQLVASRLVASD